MSGFVHFHQIYQDMRNYQVLVINFYVLLNELGKFLLVNLSGVNLCIEGYLYKIITAKRIKEVIYLLSLFDFFLLNQSPLVEEKVYGVLDVPVCPFEKDKRLILRGACHRAKVVDYFLLGFIFSSFFLKY